MDMNKAGKGSRMMRRAAVWLMSGHGYSLTGALSISGFPDRYDNRSTLASIAGWDAMDGGAFRWDQCVTKPRIDPKLHNKIKRYGD